MCDGWLWVTGGKRRPAPQTALAPRGFRRRAGGPALTAKRLHNKAQGSPVLRRTLGHDPTVSGYAAGVTQNRTTICVTPLG
jgi:hypothetical protein